MKFKAEIDNIRTLKKGSKVTLSLDEQNTASMLRSIHNFHDKPLDVELLIDSAEQKERLSRISEDQRKKIYAIFRDVADSTGNNLDAVKETLKQLFRRDQGVEDFSLSDCSRELAREFITFIIGWCFEFGVPLTDHPKEAFEDIEVYLKLCLKKETCSICGDPGETHHWNAIGMGRDRRKYDDKDHRKICLCRVHHTEVEQIGRDTFADKYHVMGVLV